MVTARVTAAQVLESVRARSVHAFETTTGERLRPEALWDPRLEGVAELVDESALREGSAFCHAVVLA